MNYRILFSAILLLCVNILFAQNNKSEPEFIVKGEVIDSTSQQPIFYATIEITSKDKSWRSGSYTDDNGVFEIILPKKDEYFINVSCIGYKNYSQKIICEKDSLVQLIVNLEPTAEQLEEFVVLGRRKLIHLSPTGLSYNLGSDAKSKSEDLLSAMRRVPMVTVDGEGKMQVKGTSNYTIYLNGKPFKIANRNPTQVLQSIPASNVSKIDVITNPDASYEASVGTTVINIITNSKKIDGYGVTFSSLVNTQPKTDNSVSFNLIKNKFRFSAGYNYVLDHHEKQPMNFERNIFLDTELKSSLSASSISKGTFQFHTANMMMEYDIDSVNNLYMDAYVQLSRINEQSDWEKLFTSENLKKEIRVISSNIKSEGAVEANILYKRLHKTKKNEIFSLGYRFAYSPDIRSAENTLITDNTSYFYKSNSDGGLHEHTLRADALLFNKKRLTIKAGILDVIRLSKSVPHYYSKTSESDSWVENIDNTSGTFKQTYNNLAGYVNGTYSFGKSSINAGTRIEYISDEVIETTNATPNKLNYINVIPRISFSTQLSDKSQFGIKYNYGVKRPSIWVMNPYIAKEDDYTVSYGNPSLKPEKYQQLGIEWMKFDKKYFISMALDYEHRSNPVYRYSFLENDNFSTLYSTYQNAKRFESLISSIFLNYSPTPSLSINTMLTAEIYKLRNMDDYVEKPVNMSFYSNMDYSFGKTWSAGANFGVSRVNPSLGYKNNYGVISSFYLSKKFMDNKVDIRLLVNYPYGKFSVLKTTEWGNGFRQVRNNYITRRSFGIKMTYHFNSGKKVAINRNKRLRENDLDRATGVK